MECDNATSSKSYRRSHSHVRFLGYHSFDHDVGTRERVFKYVRWAPALTKLVDQAHATLLNGSNYAATHIRVADAHWEHEDCQHTILGKPVASISCGDGVNVINASSMVRELWAVLRSNALKMLYVATNIDCEDPRVLVAAVTLAREGVRLVCNKEALARQLPDDVESLGRAYYISLLEQQLCERSDAFIGSRYSTWTDTVIGMRAAAPSKLRKGRARGVTTVTFEDMWATGIR
jgi:hypothetical protein